jgi:hypothetical protein
MAIANKLRSYAAAISSLPNSKKFYILAGTVLFLVLFITVFETGLIIHRTSEDTAIDGLKDKLTNGERRNAHLVQQLRYSQAQLHDRKFAARRLAILTVHTAPDYRDWGALTVNNRQKYAMKHGYSVYVEHGKSDERHPVWSKIAALLQHMKEDDHEWYWALDLDAVITNADIKATDLLDDEYDLIVSRDCNWFNAGSFFIKKSKWSMQYLAEGV